MNQKEISEIKSTTEELLQKMIISGFAVEAAIEGTNKKADSDEVKDIVSISITVTEPQFLIGQNGQTLLDVQRILRVILQKKLKKTFYIKLDINNYQKQKIEHLKNLAKSVADEVVLTREKKPLLPMSAYERRIIHEELSKRHDVATESQGEGSDRYILVIPKTQ